MRATDNTKASGHLLTMLGSGKTQQCVKDAIVVCGGRGRRMGPFTRRRQKCVLPVAGAPLLSYIVEHLAHVGCSQIHFAVNYREDDVREIIGDGSKFGIKAHYVSKGSGSTLDAVKDCLPNVHGPFYYVHGNILFPLTLLKQLSRLYMQNLLNTMVFVNGQPQINHARGQNDNQNILREIDVSERTERDLELLFMGIAIYEPALFMASELEGAHGMAEKAVKLALQRGEQILSFVHKEPWLHVETIGDYLVAKSWAHDQAILKSRLKSKAIG